MRSATVYLREENKNIKMQTFIHDDSSNVIAGKRAAMVVLAGGGYQFLANNREGEPVAVKYFASGFNTFLVDYSIGENAAFPAPVVDVSRAIVHIRRNAESYNVDPERIYVIGFSAGGHLAASMGTFWHEDWAKAYDDMKEGENKPTATLSCYPVITSKRGFSHMGSFLMILGYTVNDTDIVTDEELDRYSIEKHISEKTVPAFIWHTFEDTCVPVENAIMYAAALREKGINFELHIYPKKDHGLALATRETWWGAEHLDDPHIAAWFDNSLEFLKIF